MHMKTIIDSEREEDDDDAETLLILLGSVSRGCPDHDNLFESEFVVALGQKVKRTDKTY